MPVVDGEIDPPAAGLVREAHNGHARAGRYCFDFGVAARLGLPEMLRKCKYSAALVVSTLLACARLLQGYKGGSKLPSGEL